MRKLGLRELLSAATWGLLLVAPSAAEPFAAVRPRPAAEVRLSRPTLVFAGDLPPSVGRESLRVLIDSDDVTEFADWEEGRLRVTCPLPLEPGQHTARVVVGAAASADDLVTLSFIVTPPGRVALSSGRFSDSIEFALDSDNSSRLALEPHIDGRIEGPYGSLGYDVTIAHELRFDGDEDDLAEPDAIIEWERPGVEASLGTIAEPHAFSDSEFLGITAYRRAASALFGARAPVSIFSNLADALPTVTGERSFDQRLDGATWQLPIAGDRLRIRLLGLSVEDRSAEDTPIAALSRPERAHLIGALVDYRLSEQWEATLELASSDRDVDEATSRTSSRDEAFRLGFNGSIGEHKVDARLARVGGRFGNPADPRLALDREEAELGISRRAERWNYKVQWRAGRDGLEQGVERTDEERLAVSLGRRLGALAAKLDWSRQKLAGDNADSKQTRSQLTLSRSWRHWRLDLVAGTTDTERHGYGFSATGQDSLKLSWRWTGSKTWTLRGSLGQTDHRNAQGTRETQDFFLEPGWRSASGRLRVALNVSAGDDETPGLRNRSRRGARGTIGWELGPSKRWLLSLDLSSAETEDRIIGITMSDDRALLKVTYSPQLTWGANRAR